MQRINEQTFVNSNYDQNKTITLFKTENELRFIAWMMDDENPYQIQKAMTIAGYTMDVNDFLNGTDIITVIEQMDEYNRMYCLYGKDENNNFINDFDAQFKNAKDAFLNNINRTAKDMSAYYRKEKYPYKHSILVLTQDELRDIVDLLNVGYYTVILTEKL